MRLRVKPIKIKDMIGMNLKELKSVGCLIDVDTADVYPQLENGGPDMESVVSLYDEVMPGDWIDALSTEDIEIVKQYVDYL